MLKMEPEKGNVEGLLSIKKNTHTHTQGQTHVWNVYCLCLTLLFWYLYIFIAKIEIKCLGSVQKIVYSFSIKPAQTWRQLGYMQCNYMLSFNNYNYNHTMGEYTLH